MRNEVVLKSGMGYVKMHGFHDTPLYDPYTILENGGTTTNSNHSSLEH